MKAVKFLILFVAVVTLPNISSAAFHYLPPTYYTQDPYSGTEPVFRAMGPFVFVATDPSSAVPEMFYYPIMRQPETSEQNFLPMEYASERVTPPPALLSWSQIAQKNAKILLNQPPKAPTIAERQPAAKKVAKPTSQPTTQEIPPVTMHTAQHELPAEAARKLNTLPKKASIDPRNINPARVKMPTTVDSPSKAVFEIPIEKLAELKKDHRFVNEFQDQLNRRTNKKENSISVSVEFNDEYALFKALEMVPNYMLKKLTLHGLWVNDRVLFAIELDIKKSSLIYLDLSCCPNITDKGFICIFYGLKNLQYLNLNSTSITDGSIIGLRVPKIRYLELQNCDISDEGLFYLMKFFSQLRILNLNDCSNITDATLSLLAPKLTIKHLHLRGCNKITAEALEVIKKSRIFETLELPNAEAEGKRSEDLD